MAAFIPALLGLGSSIAGGISGQIQRRRARREIEDTPLAARAQAEANARNIQRQAIGQRTTNPMAALRSASQLGIQERQAGNVAAAREQTVRNQLLAQMRQGEANQLQQFLGQLGSTGGAIGAQLIGSDTGPADAAADPAALLAQKQDAAKVQSGAAAQQAAGDEFGQQFAPMQPQELPVEQQQFSGDSTFGITPTAEPQADASLSVYELLRRRLGGGGGL